MSWPRRAAGVEEFIAARRWDTDCLDQPYGIGAQSDELDAPTIQLLRHRYDERPPSAGWPGHTVLRFEAGGMRILLWNWVGQCDWWISSPDPELLYLEVRTLTTRFGLDTFVSSDPAGNEIEQRLREWSAGPG
ncbi:hypothetical protein ACGFJ7_31510 [Actinoplanes sp. NPDC048988]|uniref:hypothetical protein n=1 Tax=Actinoplanes sp. NPDC048988 TaxID=3363901 RepID=UPI0037126618